MPVTPERQVAGAVVGPKDFGILLAGDLVGKVIATLDNLAPLNIPIGVISGFAGAHYIKNLDWKELVMGIGIGMIDADVDAIVCGSGLRNKVNVPGTPAYAFQSWLGTFAAPKAPAPTPAPTLIEGGLVGTF